ncbi:MAG: 3-oxoacyl-[acyl-carrier-protein] reductase [Polyangia bacterium]
MRVAIVTGASRGIGRAIAEHLAADGIFVAINYTANEAAAAEVLRGIEERGGKGSLTRFDVSDGPAVDAAIKQLATEQGRLDIVVANAGVAIDALLLRAKKEDWARTLDVNLTGAFHLCKAAARYLLKSETGRIVTISSVIGEMGNAGQVAYAAAKAGLIGMTKSLARELASRAITVNCVAPGFIETDMTAKHVVGDAREALLKQIPLGRIGSAADVAETVRFLVSERASYVTGQVIRVNGGLLM